MGTQSSSFNFTIGYLNMLFIQNALGSQNSTVLVILNTVCQILNTVYM